MIGFIISAVLSALNFALYADSGGPWNLAAGIICAACAVFCFVLDLAS